MRRVAISCRSLISRPFRVLLLLAALGACPRPLSPPTPAPPPPPPPVVVPDGCLDNLGGDWTHAEDPSFRYLAVDDGGTVQLALQRVFPDAGAFRPRRFGRDAGAASEVEPGPHPGAPPVGARGLRADAGERATEASGPVVPLTTPLIELIRTPRGFVGTTVAEVQHPSGRTCVASFPTEVVACGDAGLVLRTRSAVALGDSCDAPASPGQAVSSQHVLIRSPPAAEAGARDGGWRAWVAQSAEGRDGGRTRVAQGAEGRDGGGRTRVAQGAEGRDGGGRGGDGGRSGADAGAPRRRVRDAGAPSR